MFQLSRIGFALLLLLLVNLPKTALSAPDRQVRATLPRNPSNGHYYELVSSSLNWDGAKTAAESRTYLGTQGHLATITSQEEENFINANFSGVFFWLGGIQAPGSAEPAGGFGWVTGEPFTYTDWRDNEPNDNGTEEAVERTSTNKWNDVPRAALNARYLVEYDTSPGVGLLRNTTNGHYYELVSANLNWDDAKEAAESRSYLGAPGHLATITAQNEEDFINSNFGDLTFWMGALQAPGSPEPAAGFAWVTGEPFVYTDWNSGEPNNAGDNGQPGGIAGNEDALQRNSFNRWNDVPRKSTALYLVEYDVTVPQVLSVSPSGASDKVGAKRTLTVTVSDPDGPGDVANIWLLINRQLDWTDGATLVYYPSANSPTSGLLYLRRGDEFLPPIQIGAGPNASAVLDNGAVRVVADDVTVSTAGNAIILTLPLTIRDGLVGRNVLFGRVEDKAGGVDPVGLPGEFGFVRSGTYTVIPQFTGGANRVPTLSKLTPGTMNTTLGVSGIAPTAQTFGFFAKDEDGIGDIESLWFLAGPILDWGHSATFVYYPRTRRLVLRSDDGQRFLGGGQIGSAGIIENSQVRVDLSKVVVRIYSDGKTLGLSLPLQAKSGLAGANKVWLRVQDNAGLTSPDGDNLGFVQKGNWNVKANTGAEPNPSGGAS